MGQRECPLVTTPADLAVGSHDDMLNRAERSTVETQDDAQAVERRANGLWR
jgi:hypothetical protein